MTKGLQCQTDHFIHENSQTLTDETQDLEVSCGFCGVYLALSLETQTGGVNVNVVFPEYTYGSSKL